MAKPCKIPQEIRRVSAENSYVYPSMGQEKSLWTEWSGRPDGAGMSGEPQQKSKNEQRRGERSWAGRIVGAKCGDKHSESYPYCVKK